MHDDLSTPQAPPNRRPTAVTVLGWLFGVSAAFSVVASAFVWILMLFLSRAAPRVFPPPPEAFPPGFEMLSWMFRYFNELLFLHTLLAAVSVSAAVEFLRLRAWSRSFFEALSWLGLVWTLVFGVLFAFAWNGILSGAPSPNPSASAPPPEVFRALGIFVAIFTTVFNAVFPIAWIWLLRSRFVRPAFVGMASAT